MYFSGERSGPWVTCLNLFKLQICRNINRIKICMEAGRTVVLLNLEKLYESLYDVLNQVSKPIRVKKYKII